MPANAIRRTARSYPPEAGHLSPIEQPEVVTETIRDFLLETLPVSTEE